MDYGAKNTVETFQDNYNCSHIDLLFTRCLWYNLRREKCIVQFKKPSSVFLLKLSIPHDSLVHLLPSFDLSMVFVAEKTSCAFCILTFLVSYCTYYTLHFFHTAPGFFVWKKKRYSILTELLVPSFSILSISWVDEVRSSNSRWLPNLNLLTWVACFDPSKYLRENKFCLQKYLLGGMK